MISSAVSTYLSSILNLNPTMVNSLLENTPSADAVIALGISSAVNDYNNPNRYVWCNIDSNDNIISNRSIESGVSVISYLIDNGQPPYGISVSEFEPNLLFRYSIENWALVFSPSNYVLPDSEIADRSMATAIRNKVHELLMNYRGNPNGFAMAVGNNCGLNISNLTTEFEKSNWESISSSDIGTYAYKGYLVIGQQTLPMVTKWVIAITDDTSTKPLVAWTRANGSWGFATELSNIFDKNAPSIWYASKIKGVS